MSFSWNATPGFHGKAAACAAAFVFKRTRALDTGAAAPADGSEPAYRRTGSVSPSDRHEAEWAYYTGNAAEAASKDDLPSRRPPRRSAYRCGIDPPNGHTEPQRRQGKRHDLFF